MTDAFFAGLATATLVVLGLALYAVLTRHRHIERRPDIEAVTDWVCVGPVKFDVTCARNLGWSEEKIRDVWDQIGPVARRAHRPLPYRGVQ